MKFQDFRLILILILSINVFLVNQQMVLGQTTESVQSADGTLIGYAKIGSGPVPVVIVHGALNSGAQWMQVANGLSEYCTCYVMDRWGRGSSSDHSKYSLNSEAEDIIAVLKAAGSDAILLGHSSGAIYALEAAMKSPLLGLILYEPPIFAFSKKQFFKENRDPIRVAADEERWEDMVSMFLIEEGGLSDDDLNSLKSSPFWGPMVDLAPVTAVEWLELEENKPRVKRYRDISTPTLLLTGSKNVNNPSFATQALDEMWPPEQARIKSLAEQGHTANLDAPDMVAKVVADFISELSND